MRIAWSVYYAANQPDKLQLRLLPGRTTLSPTIFKPLAHNSVTQGNVTLNHITLNRVTQVALIAINWNL